MRFEKVTGFQKIHLNKSVDITPACSFEDRLCCLVRTWVVKRRLFLCNNNCSCVFIAAFESGIQTKEGPLISETSVAVTREELNLAPV